MICSSYSWYYLPHSIVVYFFIVFALAILVFMCWRKHDPFDICLKAFSFFFGAQHYAMAGFRTCLVIHSQDPTAEYLLNCKIGTSPITCNNNLSAVKLETTKVC